MVNVFGAFMLKGNSLLETVCTSIRRMASDRVSPMEFSILDASSFKSESILALTMLLFTKDTPFVAISYPQRSLKTGNIRKETGDILSYDFLSQLQPFENLSKSHFGDAYFDT